MSTEPKNRINGTDKRTCDSGSKPDITQEPICVRLFKAHLVFIIFIIALVASGALVFHFNCDTIPGCILSILYSIIAASIFYCFQIYIPEGRKEKQLAVRVKEYIMWQILDELNDIIKILNSHQGRTLSTEDATMIVKAGSKAYNNLFKCIDDFPRTLDGNILQTIVDLSHDQFLYDLYSVSSYISDIDVVKDDILENYKGGKGKDFLSLMSQLEKLNKNLSIDRKQLLSEMRDKIKNARENRKKAGNTVDLYYRGTDEVTRAFLKKMASSGVVVTVKEKDGKMIYEYSFPIDDPDVVLKIEKMQEQVNIDSTSSGVNHCEDAKENEQF